MYFYVEFGWKKKGYIADESEVERDPGVDGCVGLVLAPPNYQGMQFYYLFFFNYNILFKFWRKRIMK